MKLILEMFPQEEDVEGESAESHEPTDLSRRVDLVGEEL